MGEERHVPICLDQLNPPPNPERRNCTLDGMPSDYHLWVQLINLGHTDTCWASYSSLGNCPAMRALASLHIRHPLRWESMAPITNIHQEAQSLLLPRPQRASHSSLSLKARVIRDGLVAKNMAPDNPFDKHVVRQCIPRQKSNHLHFN